ncbi:MAG TPA: DUF1080 domain-containing protein [Lacunisphaera sp.]|nr:DUF1080 domain-containing protein [Lacunisphaera sp.]
MKSPLPATGLFLVCALLPAFAAEPPKPLFNGRDLTGWESYLGPRYDVEKKDFAGPHIGLNTDPDKVFSVVEVDGAPAIRISGQVFGTLASADEFENYHLRVQFKWGEKRWVPRTTSRRDSGVLYHSVGPHATGWFFWMRSQEFQVQEHDCGDYWSVGGTSIKVHANKQGSAEKPDYVYSPGGAYEVFRSGAKAGGHVRHSVDAEKEHGQWNTLDLYCLGQTSLHVVNGVLVMVLRESEQPDGNGGWIPLTKGKIQLQSEGAEVFYRNITVEPIDRFPDFQLPVER